MKISARNQLTGKVSRVVAGAVNNEVELTLEHGEILTTVITKESCDVLGSAKEKKRSRLLKRRGWYWQIRIAACVFPPATSSAAKSAKW